VPYQFFGAELVVSGDDGALDRFAVWLDRSSTLKRCARPISWWADIV